MAGFTASGQDNLLMLNRSAVKAKGLHGIIVGMREDVCVYSKNKSTREMQNVYSVKSNL